MDEFPHKPKGNGRGKGFFEARTGIAKLRQLLGALDQMVTLGQTSEAQRAFAADNGVTTQSLESFRTMLHRARKAGPLPPSDELQRQAVYQSPGIQAPKEVQRVPSFETFSIPVPTAVIQQPKENEKAAPQAPQTPRIGPLIVGKKTAAPNHNAAGKNLKGMLGDTYGKV